MRLRSDNRGFRRFLWLWLVVLVVKLVLAAHLPLFVDEAFYWQEGQHLALAYSDLPGLTAWVSRLGVTLGGNHTLALRLPFIVVAAALPWLVALITSRERGNRAGWIAATAAVLLPVAGTLGVLALPDVLMLLATLLCMDAIGRMLRNVSAAATVELAAGLMIGALSHYRFLAVLGAGAVVLLVSPEGRRLLRDPRVWVAIACGLAGWAPLLAWNIGNAEAGLRFQLVERHPWAFHADGILFLLVQALLVTPLLFAALCVAAWRGRHAATAALRLYAMLGISIVSGFFLLGFFADNERVSFHWPLPGYIALLPLVPAVLYAWSPRLRRATGLTALLGLVVGLGGYAAVSAPEVRARLAASKWYPSNFAGWDELDAAVRARLARMPAETVLVAGNFKIGAELGFATGNPSIPVLDHPLNHKHGRAPQLAIWGLHSSGIADFGGKPVLLVIGSSDVRYRELLAHYHRLCAMMGPLPPPQVVNVDHGRQRYLLFALEGAPSAGEACTAPAMAWIDEPDSNARSGRRFQVTGWAFKDGAGLNSVDVLLDGKVIARAEYGLDSPGVARYWTVSTDPNHPAVGFRAQLDATEWSPGLHWLGLRLHGRDGSVEDWAEQPLQLR